VKRVVGKVLEGGHLWCPDLIESVLLGAGAGEEFWLKKLPWRIFRQRPLGHKFGNLAGGPQLSVDGQWAVLSEYGLWRAQALESERHGFHVSQPPGR
jgi:hypothetical protein